MKKILLSIAVLFSAVFILNSCQPLKDPICSYRGRGTINELAVFPDSVALGSNIVGQFKVNGLNGCSRFDGFYDDFMVDGVYPYQYHVVSVPTPQIIGNGCVCTEMVPVFEEQFTYYPSDTGLYYINYIIYGDIMQYDSVYVY